MNIFYRILLAIYAVCTVILSAAAAFIAIKPALFANISDFFSRVVLKDSNNIIILFIVALIFFLSGVFFLLTVFRRDKDKNAVSKYTNIGEIRISLNSLENIALSASRKLAGIKETRAQVTNHNGNVSIVVRVVVLPDIHIPSLSEEIQNKVKSSIEECSGLSVNDVKVLIDSIYGSQKPKVE
jgi:uncharacterized alkaline shock family protein YloU